MCPIRIHWHVKTSYKDYWRVKVTITNFNYRMNYSGWNLVVQHPNFDNLTELFSFNYEPLTPYSNISKFFTLPISDILVTQTLHFASNTRVRSSASILVIVSNHGTF